MSFDLWDFAIEEVPGPPTTYRISGEVLATRGRTESKKTPPGKAATITISSDPELTEEERMRLVKSVAKLLLVRWLDDQ